MKRLALSLSVLFGVVLALLVIRTMTFTSRQLRPPSAEKLQLDQDEIVTLYQHADARHRERLSSAYKEITGRSIEDRIAELND